MLSPSGTVGARRARARPCNAETLHDAEDFATCAINIRDLILILHIPTKGRNQGRVPDIRHHILAIYGAGRDTRENRNQTIKCRTKNQTIKIPRIPLSHPTRFRNQNNQNPGKIPVKRKHCAHGNGHKGDVPAGPGVHVGRAQPHQRAVAQGRR